MRRLTVWGILAAVAAALAAPGCGAPEAVRDSQRLQLAAMIQYRDEMDAYHQKVSAQVSADKRRELDTALAASLAQAADADGRIAVATAVEKAAKRLALEDEFRANLARLDGEFAQRRLAIGRAIDLARDTLDLLTDYGRLAALVRGLFVREPEARDLVAAYQTERSPADAADRSDPETGGR